VRIQLDRLGNSHRPPPGRFEYAGTIKFHDLARTTLDGLQKWAETSTTTINKAVENIDKNVDQVVKDLKATQDWAKQSFDNLTKAINSK
jgi:hypothetical protein